jgi:DNA-binding protein H-NS
MMTGIDLNAMSLTELKSLARNITKAIASFETRKKDEARSALEAKAREFGFSLAELSGGPAKGSRKAPAAPKYRNPENAGETWSGRGRKPQWFAAAIAKGKSPEDLLI